MKFWNKLQIGLETNSSIRGPILITQSLANLSSNPTHRHLTNQVGTNEAMQDADSFPSELIDDIKQQLEQVYETQEELEGAIQLLEQILNEKDGEIERSQDSTLSASDYELKWAFTVASRSMFVYFELSFGTMSWKFD